MMVDMHQPCDCVDTLLNVQYGMLSLLSSALWGAQLMKNEPLKITYSYWDGQGHRRTLSIRKGDSVGQFLQKVKEQLQADFRELRPVSPPQWTHAHLRLSIATYALKFGREEPEP